MDKPLPLKIQEFQKEVSDAIAKSELPIYILKYLIKDLYSEIDAMSNEFAQKELSEYYQSQNKSEEESSQD